MSSETRRTDYERAVELYYAGSAEWVTFSGSYAEGTDSEDDYEYFLGVVPPVALSSGYSMHRGAFLCGEPYTHTRSNEPVYLAMRRAPGGGCFGRLMTQREFEREFPPRETPPHCADTYTGCVAPKWCHCRCDACRAQNFS
jgi:hypothetical protein